MTILTIVLAIMGVVRGGCGPSASGCSPPKQISNLAETFKRIASEAVEELPVIFERVVGAILSFPGKPSGFGAEHLWNLVGFFCRASWGHGWCKKYKVDILLFFTIMTMLSLLRSLAWST